MGGERCTDRDGDKEYLRRGRDIGRGSGERNVVESERGGERGNERRQGERYSDSRSERGRDIMREYKVK